MDRQPSRPPFSTWEFFSACIHYLGKSALTSLYQRGERQIERWSANPATSENQRNPIDRYEVLLKKLMEEGHKDIAQTVVARQADIVGCVLTDKNYPEPDKETLELEIIDDLTFKAKYDKVLLDPKSTREECQDALRKLINELEENYVKKCQQSDWEP
ncbi:MAG: hypothetical protein GY749_22575 [Desulfobacteraceae bacterium]|nr:hypothetical protein [Desulfobacteraceae bacterium]